MPQLGYEYMQAAGIEERIVSPKFQKDIFHGQHMIFVFTQTLQYFGFAVAQQLLFSAVLKRLCDGVECILSECEVAAFFLTYTYFIQ